jgi:RimJ/RimL family protein N-acetyltransferase
MDNNTDVPEVQRSEPELRPLRALRIEPKAWNPARLEWLWKCLQTQDYAFDDFAQKLGPEAFISPLFNPASVWYELGNVGIAAFTGIQRDSNAMFHFALWDEVDPRELFMLLRELFGEMYKVYNLRRVTAMIPAFNKQAIRAATINGFKYEGEMRKAFLKRGTWHNVQIYGLLKEEFTKREVLH